MSWIVGCNEILKCDRWHRNCDYLRSGLIIDSTWSDCLTSIIRESQHMRFFVTVRTSSGDAGSRDYSSMFCMGWE